MKRQLTLLSLMVCMTIMVSAQKVTLKNVKPGQLGKMILSQTDNLRDVESLTIQSGTLDENDFAILYSTLRNVRHLDLYGITNIYFPRVYGSYSYGFTKCDSLRSIRLPKDLDRLNDRYSNVYGELFQECRYLESIEIPAGVRQIPRNTFQDCDRLREVIFNEGLELIGEQAFGNCDSIRSVTLPASLVQADAAFRGCDNLNEIICLAPAPPILKEYDIFGYGYNSDWDIENVDIFMKGRILTSPKAGNYSLTQGWNRFQRFEWTDNKLKDIRVGSEWNLLSELPQDKPNVTLGLGMDDASRFWYAGRMSVNSNSTLSLGTFNIEQDAIENNIDDFWDPNARVSYDNTNSRDLCWPTLIVQSSMRADTVRTTLRWHAWTAGQSGTQMWAFSSLPFDCKLSDLRVSKGGKGLQYSIMKYSGLMRSQAKFNEVWIKQTQDSIIHAGEGFIIAVGWDTVTDMFSDLQFTAINNENKNRLFSTDDISLPLKQYTAAAACDRSWNFIGNPYPCFYSTKYLDPAAPFVVYDRDNRRYQVYSPIDDDYVLHPFEGFFIQKPLGYDELDFPRYGRFQTIAEYEAWKKDLNFARRKAHARRTLNANRKVHNISLSDFDKCRLVVNPEASNSYEAGTDATKFPQFDGTHTLLYIIGAEDTRYAISEQPFADGDTLRLGMVIAEDGEYTIAADSTLTLIDRETGISHTLSQPYTFKAEAGEHNVRFALTKSIIKRGFVTSQQQVTIGDVEYYINTDDNYKNRGVAMVGNIISSSDTVEIPAYITYDGEQYEVLGVSTYSMPETLKHLILPSTITSIFPLSDDYTVTLYALTPPDMRNSYIFDDNQYTLYVPKAVINDYKTTYPYWQFKNILPAESEADVLCVQGSNVTMDDNGKPTNKPSIEIRCKSGLTVEGSKTMDLSSFDMEYIINRLNYGDTDYSHLLTKEDNATGTLITSSPMTADKVSVTFSDFYNSEYFRFFCLPFNVQVADIIDNRNEGELHIYRYNSTQRASGQYGSNWQKVGSGETLKAGEGFIMKAYHYGNYKHFTFPAVDDAKKNDIFATSRTITLTDYPAGKAEDRGWNLVGNPYPAYYDMSQSTLKQPYQIYGQTDGSAYSTNRRYYAYSRDDDDILLRPFEGFFVQYSDTEKSFSMPGGGRYHGYPEFIYEKTWSSARALTRAADENRHLYDIELTGADIHDRTRIVLNSNAKANLEPECDAVKLDGNDITTLYTEENGIRLAINERPAPAAGSITLIANINADGIYTLSLGKHNANDIIVTDVETGSQVSLETGSYTFTAKTGSRRFSVSFGNGTTSVNEQLRVKSEESSAAPVFDLQGRKVEGELKQGVYIRNGRKVIIK